MPKPENKFKQNELASETFPSVLQAQFLLPEESGVCLVLLISHDLSTGQTQDALSLCPASE